MSKKKKAQFSLPASQKVIFRLAGLAVFSGIALLMLTLHNGHALWLSTNTGLSNTAYAQFCRPTDGLATCNPSSSLYSLSSSSNTVTTHIQPSPTPTGY